MNGVVQRSHFSLRIKDVSPQVRQGLWKHAVFSLLMAATFVAGCIGLATWLIG